MEKTKWIFNKKQRNLSFSEMEMRGFFSLKEEVIEWRKLKC